MNEQLERARADDELTDLDRAGATRAGVVAMAPMVLAYAPFALVIGSTVAQLDEPVAGWAGSWLILGGSAHLAAVRSLIDGAPILAVATALLVHARLLVYGASMAPRWRDQPRWFRVVAPALLIDPTSALAERDSVADPRGLRRSPTRRARPAMTTWVVLVAVGVGSYAMRALPMLLDGARSPRVEQAIAYAGTAALAALIAIGLRRSSTSATETAAVGVATAAAVVVAIRNASLPRVLLVGAAGYTAAKGATWLLA